MTASDEDLKNVQSWSRAIHIRDGFYIYVAYPGNGDINKGWELDTHIMPRLKEAMKDYPYLDKKPE